MCGIAGIVAAGRLHADDLARVPRMRDVIAHRGPDDAGLFMRRSGGARPPAPEHRRSRGRASADRQRGRHRLDRLQRRDLQPRRRPAGARSRGPSLPTRSDTETIVHAYEQWGDACVERLRGMFAFAIWDAPRRRLLLARDRLGVKPLYWAQAGDRLLFGSEIKAILESGLIRAEADEARAARAARHALSLRRRNALQGHPSAAARPHAGVRGRPRSTTRQYWDIPAGRRHEQRARRMRTATLVGRSASCSRKSVRIRLMADVPLGMFLSGGLDSSAIAALMARMIDRPLQTFSVAFKDRAFSELDYARQVATAIKADAHEIVIDDAGLLRCAAAPDLARGRADRASLERAAVLRVRRSRAQHVKVVLTGEGSDELLAGYGKYPRALAELACGGRLRRRARAAARVDRRATSCRKLPRPAAAAMRAARSWPWRGRRRRCSSTTSRRSGCGVSASCSIAGLRRRPLRPRPTDRRASTSTRRTGAARSSIACSTPTSRPTSSSC